MSDIDDLRKLIAAFRTQPGFETIAYTIEAGLDEALGTVIDGTEAILAVSKQQRDALVIALQSAIILQDGRDPNWATWNDLLGQLHSLAFPEPLVAEPDAESEPK